MRREAQGEREGERARERERKVELADCHSGTVHHFDVPEKEENELWTKIMPVCGISTLI